MAVATRPSGDALGVDHAPALFVSAGDADLRRRIELALHEGSRGASPLLVSSDDELLGIDPGAEAIVVLASDTSLPHELAALRRLRRELRGTGIVAVAPLATGAGVRRALDAGADAVVFEPELEATLAVAVSAVASGQSVVPRSCRASVERPALSHRERQVLGHVSRGLTNAQIAEELFLSESTIKSHLSSAFAKFGVRSRREAASLFRELEPPEAAT